jgi:hypothetical protein
MKKDKISKLRFFLDNKTQEQQSIKENESCQSKKIRER